MFTTHGRVVHSELSRGVVRLPVRDTETLLSKYVDTGFGYQPYTPSDRHHQPYGDHDRYGVSLSKPAWVCEQVEQHPQLRLLAYTESAWMGRQDAVACLLDGTG